MQIAALVGLLLLLSLRREEGRLKSGQRQRQRRWQPSPWRSWWDCATLSA